MWDSSLNIFFAILTILICCWFIGHVLLTDNFVYIQGRKRHNWKSIKNLNRSCFCSECLLLLTSNYGLYCDYCGICCDPNCLKKVEKNHRCKECYTQSSTPPKHHWIKGNLPLHSECFICKEDIDYHTKPGLYGYRCCWCQKCSHNKCFTKLNQECDFGLFRDMIVPPSSIIAARTKGAPKLHLVGLTPPIWPDWKPLIVIANVKSGSSTASEVLSYFRGILHPLQVMELNPHGPQDMLQWAIKASPKKCRILVAGGDGTVGWVLNTIYKMGIDPIPEVAILPLGTGNDLSRVMGWGSEPPDDLNTVDILRKIQNAEVIPLDRWFLEIQPLSRNPLKRISHKSCYVYNYFSIGVDAQVTFNFHKARESPFYILSSRIINKMLYMCYGYGQVVQPDCVGLHKNIELYLDDCKINIPELQSIVCLNIDSWGAGVRLWDMSRTIGDNEIHSPSDGILEIFGIVSSFHIAQLQVGLSKPIRLGRARSVRIKLNQSFPVQADGEPWIQSPCEFKINQINQATMLKCND